MWSLPAGVSVTQSPTGSPLVKINTETAVGALDLHGAQVLGWRPRSQAQEVLYLSPLAHYEPKRAIRGGIPVCAPWFAAGKQGTRQPAHGWLRTSQWELANIEERGTDIVVCCVYEWEGNEDFPAFSAQLCASFGRELVVTLDLHARAAAEFEAALHTYFAVSDVRQVSISGLGSAPYESRLDPANPQSGRAPQQIELREPIDTIFVNSAAVRIQDPQWQRCLEISNTGGRNTVVWNPGAAGAAKLSDLPDADWQKFCCVETAVVKEQAIALAPGECYRIAQRIEVKEI